MYTRHEDAVQVITANEIFSEAAGACGVMANR